MSYADTREIEFSQPVRQIASMLVALGLVLVVGYFLYQPIRTVFFANLYLNGLIFSVFLFGVGATFWQVLQLTSSVSWLEGFAVDRPGLEFSEPPRLLASLSAILRDQRARRSLTTLSTRSILDSVATRVDESRDLTRYIVNLLIFLGLLGTFWGLSNTVPAVVDTIRSLAPQEGEGSVLVFDRLMTGLEKQLGGMGTAFASSLLGLAGSLVVGLLELFASHAQNRFYRELEEWLSSITRISIASDGDGGGEGAIGALIDQNAAQIDALSRIAGQSDERRSAFEARLSDLTDSVARLASGLAESRASGAGGGPAADPATLRRQTELLEIIAERLAPDPESAGDPEARARLRSIERTVLMLAEEIAAGRHDAVSEIRAELSGLAQALEKRADLPGGER